MTPLRIRAHHILCLQGFRGKGYSPSFTRRFAEILAEWQRAPESVCEIITVTDAFCAPCPHQDGLRCVKDADADRRMRALDFSVLAKLDMREGDRGAFTDLIKRVNSRLKSRSDVADVCGDCSWRGDCTWHQTLQ